ncbi:hypothetical protein BDV93DRAFT_52563 [Ceratobasidium sp. AG-I]|nr:hypothetical protein BDV93DRAFT_52563 [Ceratobasidium sp. AG-I]
MTYFNEAIVASYRRPPRYSSVDKKYHSMIRDKSLNEVLSRLPKGCVLTCVLDCNCSGRLIGIFSCQIVLAKLESTLMFAGNNAKLAGREFHGGKVFTKISGDDWSLIKAKVITWSACDIGQQAGEVAGLNTGILTTAFTQAVASRIPFPGHAAPCVGEIFDEGAREEVCKRFGGREQYRGAADEETCTVCPAETFERLKQPFVI